MPANQYSRPADGIKFSFKGMNIMLPPDSVPDNKYPVAVNFRAYLGDSLTPRLPQGAAIVTLNPTLLPIHSLRRLNDTTPLGPASGFSLVEGASDELHVNQTLVESGFSGNRLSLVSFRPNASPQPWMYVGDSVKQVKTNSGGVTFNTGIAEPQDPAVVTDSTEANPAINSPVFYRYTYRSQTTGAVSNPSPEMRIGYSITSFAPLVTYTPSTDPQVDTVDIYRFDSGLLDYTYVGSSPNSSTTFIDTLSDAIVADNPELEFDNFEPFPSIDIPHSGTVTINGTTITLASGDSFNVRWAPGTTILINGLTAQLYNRPSSTTQLEIVNADAIAETVGDRAGAGANDTGSLIPAGTVNWTSPNNVTSTSAYAVATLSAPTGSQLSKALLTNNYGFSIPAGSTVLGIQVDYEVVSTIPVPPSAASLEVYMFKPSTGTIFAAHIITPPNINTPETAGSSTDLWGTTWTDADINNANFGPVFSAVVAAGSGDISVRNVVTTIYYQSGAGAAVSYEVQAATLLDQPMPAWWGPTDNAGYFFACGDPLRPGTLYFTKGNNPDSAPDTNQLELCSPSEPLINGCIVGGLGMAFSTERAWLLYPNFAQAVATVLGVQGNPFNPVESISERGLYARQGICTDGGGWVFFICKDGIRKSPAGSGSSSITDTDLYNLFPHEGVPQQTYVLQSAAGVIFTLSPPDYTNPNGMALRFAQGYVYFDYVGLDAAVHTLVYDVLNDAWSVDIYGVSVTIHADNEGGATGTTGADIGIGTLMGCSDGTVRPFDPAASESATAMIATQAYNNGDRRATKRFGDVYIESLCPNGKTQFTAAIFANRYAVALAGLLTPALFPSVANGLRNGDIGEINSGTGVYDIDLELLITVPVNSVGSRLFTWQPSLVAQPATTGLRVTDWDDAGSNSAKFIQGMIIEADSFNVAKSFTVQNGDDDSIHSLAEMGTGIVFNGQSKKALSFAVPFIAHNMRIVPDSTKWNLFGVQWIFTPYPELVLEWHSQPTGHGFDGWQFIKEMNITHLSTADLTLTLVRDYGSPIVVTVPNSGGVQKKTNVPVQIPPPGKFKIVSYNLTSSQPFRMWASDLEVYVRPWGSPGPYQVVKPFGAMTKGLFSMSEAQI